MIKSDRKIIVSGAGLVGSLLALRMLQKGYDVDVFESRSDLRTTSISAGKSINLALSPRGLQALRKVGVIDQVLKNVIEMEGRLIHEINGDLKFQAYSARSGEWINSISRRVLNSILMDEIEKLKPGAIKFNQRLVAIGEEGHSAVFENEEHQQTTYGKIILLATDGANSFARKWILDQTPGVHFNYSQKFQDYGYKELTIPPGPNGEFRIMKNALHIWPRGHFMVIALPNPDASYTVTLFLPFKGKESFDQLQNTEQLLAFFKLYFPDIIPHLPDLETEFFENPTGYLMTVKCEPWNYEDKIVLLGDAAHALIPFYGQGMNCGFEDVFVFDQLLDQYDNWLDLFTNYSKARKKNGDAIADLAEDNFIEMRDKVADPVFQRKRKLEMELERKFPDYYSKYALVTFRPDVPYYDAMVLGRKQDELLMSICANHTEHWTDEELKTIYDQLINIKNSA